MDIASADRRRVSFVSEDPLFRFELCVARRADELARVSPSGGSPKRDRETWRRAEGELLAEFATGDLAIDDRPVKGPVG